MSIPKQLIKIAGKTVMEHTIQIFQDAQSIDEIFVLGGLLFGCATLLFVAVSRSASPEGRVGREPVTGGGSARGGPPDRRG